MGSVMARLQAERPQILITIDGDDPTVHNGHLGPFSTLDTIKGIVSIVGMSDIRFDDIQITFEGGSHHPPSMFTNLTNRS